MSRFYEVDVVIPVFQEGERIASTVETLFSSNETSFRILICYDLDDDNTLPVLETLPSERRSRIAFVKNPERGPHAAVRAGFSFSNAPAVLAMPADDDYNRGLLDRMMRLFREEYCEIVVADRFLPGGCMVGCPLLKATLVRTAAWILRHGARLPTADPTNGLRLFSRRLLDAFPIESRVGFSYSIELLAKAHRAGWKIGVTPALWYERKSGTSRFRILRWLPEYLRWFFYILETTWLRKRE